MAITNRGRVEEALDALRGALLPYFEGLVTSRYGASAWNAVVSGSDRFGSAGDNIDLTRLFTIFHEYRNDLFRDAMGKSALDFVHEAQGIRKRWADQEQFTTQDTLRALDTIGRVIDITNSPEAYEAVHRSHEQLLRSLYSEQTRSETRKITQSLKMQGDAALVPWREIATPHEDVRTGNLKEAEFAADLDQVAKGRASSEYQDPVEFFQRTYLTEGLSALLVTALNRLYDRGGDPVLELQTNFGGGKTHSMIALYHLASGVDLNTLPGLDPILQATGVNEPQFVQRAVLVGTKLSANEPRTKADGTVVRTLWGELAYQLAGEAGYRLVAESDRNGTSPGADVLREIFDLAGPSLILIDEWVAFVRNLYFTSGNQPAAGSFDANLTFAQVLTEAVTNTPQILLAASLPSSDMEVGGEGGKEALKVLKHTFSRVKTSWRAASSNEGFEIVRRRLFQDVTDHRRRDATIKLYLDMYRNGKSQYPADVHQADYAKRMQSAYPFHPETFDQLFEKWGSLETFQRTRGVLRLMANVVHTLWERKDASPLIMPANIPLDAVGVVTEMGGYLPDSWTSVIEHDIDGDHALSLLLDVENQNFDKYSATRRVARTIFLASAPTFRADNRGVGDQSIRLGVVQPGENASIFGDALRAYSDKATYLYSEHGNYWFSTQQSITETAQQRIEQLADDDVDHEIGEILRSHQGKRGQFERVVVTPASSGDVVDSPDVTLVILGPDDVHARNQAGTTPAIEAAVGILDTRGDGRRVFRNALLFLAPDRGKLAEVRKAVAQQIVWRQIEETHEALNLDAHQLRQARSRAIDASRRVEALVRDTWTWLLVPHAEPVPGSPVAWDTRLLRSISEHEFLPEAASKRAITEEDMILVYAGSNVRRAIQEIPAFASGWTHIAARDLAAWFPSYLYLPRLKNTKVLEEAIRQGLRSISWQTDAFAWADSWDEATDRYVGLTTSITREAPVSLTGSGVLVHPDAAQRQFDADQAARQQRERERVAASQQSSPSSVQETPHQWQSTHTMEEPGTGDDRDARIIAPSSPVTLPDPQRYFGSVTLNPQTLASQVREISNEVISNLQTIYGSQIRISLEIEAIVPDGIPEDRRSIVAEKSKALKFDQSDFADQ